MIPMGTRDILKAMNDIKNLHAALEYDEEDISIRVAYAFEDIEVRIENSEMTIARDGDDLVVTIKRGEDNGLQ